MAWPAASSADLADTLRQLAIDNGAAVLGTGINPGFVMDLLVIALSGVCFDITSIAVTRTNDLSPYGPSVLASQGVGLSPAAFQAGLHSGSVVGHFGFAESIHMIAAALGWEIERIEETRTAIVSSVARETPFVKVAPGMVAGCHHTAVAYRNGTPVITLDHPQQIHPQAEGLATGDRVEITGTPNVSLSGSPEIPGGTGTIALAVNTIPRLLQAAPGLYSMAELPVAAAMPGDNQRVP
jgi:4-hydroxy-tetrahydrodipicolinate reductase